MASTPDPAPAGGRREDEVPQWRLHLLRVPCLIVAIGGFFQIPKMLIDAGPTDRGMIDGFLTGLWLMSFLALRYPLLMLPIFLFELVWKGVWLLAFGLPQWLSGTGSPRLQEDLLGIGAFPFLIALILPWPYIWRHYVKAPAERWR